MNNLNSIYKEIESLVIMEQLLGKEEIYIKQETVHEQEVIVLGYEINGTPIMCFYVEFSELPFDCYGIGFSRFDLTKDLVRLGHYAGKPYDEEALLSFIKKVFLLSNF